MNTPPHPTRAALAAARAALTALGHALDALDGSLRDDDDELLVLRDGAMGLTGETLCRWAREGRLRAFEAERGRLVAWRSDVRRAVEAQPARQLHAVDNDNDNDPLAQAIASGDLRAGGGGRR